jgi:hypothetical protein
VDPGGVSLAAFSELAEATMISPQALIVVVVLVVVLIGGLPVWPYSRQAGYGYWPSGLVAVALILLVLWALGAFR